MIQEWLNNALQDAFFLSWYDTFSLLFALPGFSLDAIGYLIRLIIGIFL